MEILLRFVACYLSCGFRVERNSEMSLVNEEGKRKKKTPELEKRRKGGLYAWRDGRNCCPQALLPKAPIYLRMSFTNLVFHSPPPPHRPFFPTPLPTVQLSFPGTFSSSLCPRNCAHMRSFPVRHLPAWASRYPPGQRKRSAPTRFTTRTYDRKFGGARFP